MLFHQTRCSQSTAAVGCGLQYAMRQAEEGTCWGRLDLGLIWKASSRIGSGIYQPITLLQN